MPETHLTLNDVSFSYGENVVVDAVKYAVRPGRMTAICGPNGSGKSTLFALASGQIEPQSGSVRLNAKPIGDYSAKSRARIIAMLPQSPDAPPELIVRDLVALGRYAHRSPLSNLSDADQHAISAALTATDMTGLADRPLVALSGGQRQRAWIAMVLAQEAPLLLLDEPTNHLDISHAVETLDLLKELVLESGKTIVAILHDINLMASHADDVVLMKQGAVLSAGAFEEVVTEASISELYGKTCVFGSIAEQSRPFLVVR